jgi:hypothetical protein
MKVLRKGSALVYDSNIKRREFLTYVAASASIVTVAAACTKNNSSGNGIDLGSGDLGLLNYTYAIAQLQAAFYLQVIKTPYSSLTGDELSLITDIKDHEITHTQFFKAVLITIAIPPLEFDFTSVNFANRSSVLGIAKTFGDITVSAYNGAGRLFTNADYLLIAGKIVSVEARQVAYIRDLISYGSFADSTAVDTSGLDMEQNPTDVLAALDPYIKSKLDPSNLPTL